MRNKVLAVLDTYSEGGTIEGALAVHGMTQYVFRRNIRRDPDLLREYYERQEDKGEMAGDQLVKLAEDLSKPTPPKPKPGEEVLEDAPIDPRRARALADVLLAIMERYKPSRFSPKMQLTVEAKPNLVTAISDGRSRALLPSRDLMPVIDLQAIEITPLCAPSATDMQSEEGEIDPFS